MSDSESLDQLCAEYREVESRLSHAASEHFPELCIVRIPRDSVTLVGIVHCVMEDPSTLSVILEHGQTRAFNVQDCYRHGAYDKEKLPRWVLLKLSEILSRRLEDQGLNATDFSVGAEENKVFVYLHRRIPLSYFPSWIGGVKVTVKHVGKILPA